MVNLKPRCPARASISRPPDVFGFKAFSWTPMQGHRDVDCGESLTMYYGGEPQDAAPRGVTILRMVVPVGIFLWGLYNLTVTLWPLNEFQRSPGCVPGHSVSASLAPCVDVPVTVTGYRYVHHRRSNSEYYLTLAESGGRTSTVQILSDGLYADVDRGTTLTAQVWRGKIVELSVGTVSSDTTDRPGSGISSSLIWIAIGVLGFFWALAQGGPISFRPVKPKPAPAQEPISRPPGGKDYW
jgi:hypothetical protein